jgi:hypothetical protein
VKLIQLSGGSHDFAGETGKRPDWPDFFSESVAWMDLHLKSQMYNRFSN